jgi:hypothetical protein
MEFMSVTLNSKTGQIETWIGNRKPPDMPWELLIEAAESSPDILAVFRLERIA